MPENEVVRNLNKIRYKDGLVEIYWWTPNGNDREKGEFVCKDKPMPEFEDAMQALRADMVATLDLPKGWLERVDITTVTLTEDTKQNLSVILSGSGSCAAGGFALNTPRMRQPGSADEDSGPGSFTIDQWARVAALATEAHKYHGGHRVQRGMQLDDGGDNPSSEDDRGQEQVG